MEFSPGFGGNSPKLPDMEQKVKRRTINYARADIAKANTLHRELDNAWLNAVQREKDKPMTTQPPFVCVAGLYERTSTTGRTVYAGAWGKTRLYLLPCDANNGPTWWLAVRSSDYDPDQHGPDLGQSE